MKLFPPSLRYHRAGPKVFPSLSTERYQKFFTFPPSPLSHNCWTSCPPSCRCHPPDGAITTVYRCHPPLSACLPAGTTHLSLPVGTATSAHRRRHHTTTLPVALLSIGATPSLSVGDAPSASLFLLALPTSLYLLVLPPLLCWCYPICQPVMPLHHHIAGAAPT
jgi:hypothetical protein